VPGRCTVQVAQSPLRAVRLSSMVLLYIVGELCCVAACFVLWVACGGRLTRPWVIAAHRKVLRLFLGALLRAAAPAFGFRLEVDEPQRHPDDLALVNGDRPLVVLARHGGPGASFALVHVLLGRWSRQVHVILKDTLRLDPAIDLLLTRTGCTWVPTNGARRSTPDAVAAAARSLAAADALLLFPEGADWTPARHLGFTVQPVQNQRQARSRFDAAGGSMVAAPSSVIVPAAGGSGVDP